MMFPQRSLSSQDLPTAEIGIEIPPSVLQDIVSASALHDTDSSSEVIIDIPDSSVSSPTLSISTMSDLTQRSWVRLN